MSHDNMQQEIMTCLTDAFPDIPTPFDAIAYNAPGLAETGGLALVRGGIFATVGIDTDPDTGDTHWCVDAYREDDSYVSTLVFSNLPSGATAMEIATAIMTTIPSWIDQLAA